MVSRGLGNSRTSLRETEKVDAALAPTVAFRSPWLVLVDFDGTLTTSDADFQIADALLPPDRQGAYRPLADAYERLEISTLEYFDEYFRIVDQPVAAIVAQAERLSFRPGAVELAESCRQLGLEPRIVSEGLDIYVMPALRAAGLGAVDVACNRLVGEGSSYRVLPARGAESCERCVSCKGSYVRCAKRDGRKVAVIGNGASDLCAARLADLVIARDSLLQHCRRERIICTPWESLADVIAVLRTECGRGS